MHEMPTWPPSGLNDAQLLWIIMESGVSLFTLFSVFWVSQDGTSEYVILSITSDSLNPLYLTFLRMSIFAQSTSPESGEHVNLKDFFFLI